MIRTCLVALLANSAEAMKLKSKQDPNPQCTGSSTGPADACQVITINGCVDTLCAKADCGTPGSPGNGGGGPPFNPDEGDCCECKVQRGRFLKVHGTGNTAITDTTELKDKFIEYLSQYMTVDQTIYDNASAFFDIYYADRINAADGMKKNPDWNDFFSYIVCILGGEPEGREACTWYNFFLTFDSATYVMDAGCPATGGGNV